MLAIESVRVQFGGVVALDDVSLEVDAGLVTGLIGPNGAGKTTLFNVVTGLQPVNHRKVRLDGVDVTRPRPSAGPGWVSPEPSSAWRSSARERAGERAGGRRGPAPSGGAQGGLGRTGRPDPRPARIDPIAELSADALPTGLARLVELGRALATGPRLLLLDEPGAGLNATETARIGQLLGELAGQGMGVLLVEHDMSLVMDCCDLIYVLDFGELIARGTPAEIQVDPVVQKAYLGDVDVVVSGEADGS